MKVPVSTLVPLPDSLSFVTGAAISCGTGTAWGALRRVQLQGGETIAIFGQGPIISEPHALPAPKAPFAPFLMPIKLNADNDKTYGLDQLIQNVGNNHA